MIYKEKENRLYYDGELVRYFEDIVSSDYYLKWPSQNGTVDVYAERNASGALTGVNPFDQQEFSDRTSSLQTAICELEISNTIDGYTGDVENMVKERIAEAYEVYRQYGLTYDRESDRLYYNEELVGYFEDRRISHFFGPFEDSTIKIYAIRDKDGVLTGLDVDLNNDDNPIEKITWEEITEDGVDEELLLRNLDTEVLTQVATELQTLVDEAIAEERENPMILIAEGWARVLEYDRFKKVLEIGAPAMKPLYFILYKSPNRGEYEYLCSYALYKLSDFDFEWSTTDEFMEKFNEQILEERQSQ